VVNNPMEGIPWWTVLNSNFSVPFPDKTNIATVTPRQNNIPNPVMNNFMQDIPWWTVLNWSFNVPTPSTNFRIQFPRTNLFRRPINIWQQK
jgi:hypothetical protein